MSQVIAKMSFDAGWGGTHGQMCLNGGSWATLLTFGEDAARIPVPGPGVFSRLGILGGSGHPAFGITFRVNNVDTDLAVDVTADDTDTVFDTAHTATVVDGDDYSLHMTGFGGGDPNGDLGFVVVFTPVTPTHSIYGLRPIAGSIADGDAWAGGAFGNGLLGTYAGSGTSNTYSISTLAGDLTAIRLASFRGAAGSGNTFTAAVLLNGVLQDGSGSTVDTRVTLAGTDTSTAGTFTLPIAVGDKVDLHLAYSGDDLGFALANVALGCLFEAEADNLSMWCGGTNDAISRTDTSWHWPTNDQNATTEVRAATPVGAIPFTVTGLYVEHSAPPTSGKSWTDTFRVNSADTALTVTVSDAATTGLITVDVALAAGDLIDVQVAPTSTPQGAEFHWGLALEASLPDTGGGGDSGGGETVCVTTPPSVGCWSGGVAGALGCITTPDGKAASWANSYSVSTQAIGLLREGQP